MTSTGREPASTHIAAFRTELAALCIMPREKMDIVLSEHTCFLHVDAVTLSVVHRKRKLQGSDDSDVSLKDLEELSTGSELSEHDSDSDIGGKKKGKGN